MPIPNIPGQSRLPGAIAMGELTSADVAIVNIPVFHEIGWDLAGGVIETTRIIAPSRRPVAVKVVSEVVTKAVQRAQSPEYMGTIRRRRSGKIRAAVAGLAQHAERQDFVVCTYPILKEINELLIVLANSETEGNSREALRQIRNTLMNGGWNKYRTPAVRATVGHILAYLAEADEVVAQKVDEAFDQMDDAGLDPVGAPLPELTEAETNGDAENEVPG
jgi:hypothetical protein